MADYEKQLRSILQVENSSRLFGTIVYSQRDTECSKGKDNIGKGHWIPCVPTLALGTKRGQFGPNLDQSDFQSNFHSIKRSIDHPVSESINHTYMVI